MDPIQSIEKGFHSMIPFYNALFHLISVLPSIGISHYTAKMLMLVRFGRLERGWRLVTTGATIAPTGLLILTLQDFVQSYSSLYLAMDFLGTIACAIGLTLFFLGFRSHYLIWSGKKVNTNE
jgi:hypothetical protein